MVSDGVKLEERAEGERQRVINKHPSGERCNFKCIAPVSHGVLLMTPEHSPRFCLFIFSAPFFYYGQLGTGINPAKSE